MPAGAITARSVGWHFGGLAMATRGPIAAISFVPVLRGQSGLHATIPGRVRL